MSLVRDPDPTSETVGRVAIGLDLGTSGLKAVAIGEDGRVVARARRAYPTARPESGAAEQSPEAWRRAAWSALKELSKAIDPHSWMAIGLSAMLPTLVVLDEHTRPIGAAITWEDSRAEAHGAQLRKRVGSEELYRWTGQRIDGRYLLPMADRLLSATGDPTGESAWTIAGAKDYLYFVLTGELLTDPSTATGYGAYNLDLAAWDDRITSRVSQSFSLPPIVPSTTRRPLLGTIARDLGCVPETPVVIGGADSVMGAYGLGVKPGDVAYIAGTSTVILGHSRDPVVDSKQRCLVTPMAERGYGLEMDLLSTGSAFAWMADLLQLRGGAAELIALAVTVPPAPAPTVLPFVAPGEQGALWCPTLRGSIHGLSLATTPASIARGLVTGILIESRRCVGVLDELLPGSGLSGDILVSGASAASLMFMQDLADATGRAVCYVEGETDHSAIGAALLAGRSGTWEEFATMPRQTIEPRPACEGLWAHLAGNHDALLAATGAATTKTQEAREGTHGRPDF